MKEDRFALFEKAVVFAVEAHAGQKRKGKEKPYILHPLEVAAIVGTYSNDPEVLGRLHHVITPPVGETAPAAICVLTQRINAYRDKCFAVQDYSAAIQNMLLAIVELGYQSCWYEGHITDDDRICDQMAQILHVPDDYELVCFLPVGVAENDPILPKKKTFEERAWFNSFNKTE